MGEKKEIIYGRLWKIAHKEFEYDIRNLRYNVCVYGYRDDNKRQLSTLEKYRKGKDWVSIMVNEFEKNGRKEDLVRVGNVFGELALTELRIGPETSYNVTTHRPVIIAEKVLENAKKAYMLAGADDKIKELEKKLAKIKIKW